MGEILGSFLQLLFTRPGWALLLLLAVVVGWIAWTSLSLLIEKLRDRVRQRRDFRQGGWMVKSPDSGIEYHEVVDGRLEHLRFRTEWSRDGPYVYLPTEFSWNGKTASWARGRRTEIVARIQSRLHERYAVLFE
jgi:hypothetical protein